MAVYRVAPANAQQVFRELLGLGVTAEVERYSTATYLVVDSDRADVDRLVRARVPTAVLVPRLDDLT